MNHVFKEAMSTIIRRLNFTRRVCSGIALHNTTKLSMARSMSGGIFRSIGDKYKSFVNNKELNTIPNIITFSRILASPGLAYAIAMNMKATALVTCVVFGFSDWLDGYLAKKLNQKTIFGAFLDPMADKIMIASICSGLAYNGLIPLPLAALIVGRDAVLLGLSFLIRARERPKGSPFFDTTYSATFQIIPSDLSKVGTFYITGSVLLLCHIAGASVLYSHII